MVTEELLDYVRNQRREGVSEQAIREALLSVGWTQEDAKQALALTVSEAPASAAPNNPPDLEKPVEEASQMGEEPQIKPEETGQETPQNEQLGQQQQEEDLASFKPVGQLDQAPAEEPKPAPLEEETVADNKPQGETLETLPGAEEDTGPIELNDQGQVIKNPQSPSAVETQQNTEISEGLETDVSPLAEASPNVSQEPVSQQPVASTPNENPSEDRSSGGQEQNSQVAVDPKAK